METEIKLICCLLVYYVKMLTLKLGFNPVVVVVVFCLAILGPMSGLLLSQHQRLANI